MILNSLSPSNTQQNTMPFRTLEITVLSAEDLRINTRSSVKKLIKKSRSVRKNTYVVVRTDPLNYRQTTVDTEGGSYPSWDQKLVLDMPKRETFLTLEVHYKSTGILGNNKNRIIGSARISVTDFMGRYLPEGYLSFLRYTLTDPEGGANGIVNVSVRVKVPEYLAPPTANNKKVVPPVPKVDEASTSAQPALPNLPVNGKSPDGVVTGIPVWNIC